MKTKALDELDYDFELERIAEAIKKEKAKKVLLQLPDGLKPFASSIADELREKTQNKVEIFIWLNSCFGACDIPLETERLGVDLIVQFGHSAWDYSKKKGINVLK